MKTHKLLDQSPQPQHRIYFRQLFSTLLLVFSIVVSNAALFDYSTVEASTAADSGYRDFNFGTTVISTPTGEKPESKLWWNDGFWWGYLFNTADKAYHLYRLDMSSQDWIDTGTRGDTRPSTLGDVLWDGQYLYIASHIYSSSGSPTSSNWGRLYRYRYNSINKVYTLDNGFPVDVTRGRSETLVIDKDSTGRLWVTYVESGKVMMNHSTTDDATWSVPFVLPASSNSISVSTDDISSIVAFQGNKIGVFWSNQKTKKVYFAIHNDGDPVNSWQPEQTALPGPKNCTSGSACADDHLNLKSLQADNSGRVFAAIKTSLSSSSAPLVMLLVRDLNGTWNSHVFGRVSEQHTRPIVLLDEENGKIYMFATAPESGGIIYYKSSNIDNISFPTGLGTPFIKSSSDTRINNATSTKQNLNSQTGLVVLASDKYTHYYLHNYMALGSGPTNRPPVVNAGPDQSIILPNTASLSGSVTDDGLPNPPGTTTVSWSKVSGPGTVTFANVSSVVTSASFSASGSYVLRLTASDSVLSSWDDITINVSDQSQTNQPPVVNAGPDQSVVLPNTASLIGTVDDDGLPVPPGGTSLTWSKVSGPGTVIFGNPNAASTTASFSSAGSYVLRLTASDGALTASDDLTVAVSSQGQITVLEIRVSSKTDDSEESATGVINYDRTKLTMVYFTDNQQVGMRFTGITIPQGATITNAYIQFVAGYTNSGTTNLIFQAQDDDNSATFTTSAFDISARPKTTASASWSPEAWLLVGEAGSKQQTPDLKSVIQEVVDRPGWTSGNALAIIITGTGKRVAYSYNGLPDSAPLIHIEFSVP